MTLWLDLTVAAVFLVFILTVTVYSVQNILLEPIYAELGALCEKLSKDFRLSQKALALILAMGDVAGDPSMGAKFTWATIKSRLGLVKKKTLEDEIGPLLRPLQEYIPNLLRVRVDRAVQLCLMVLIIRNPIFLAQVLWEAKIITKQQVRNALLQPITARVGKFRGDIERFIFPMVRAAAAGS